MSGISLNEAQIILNYMVRLSKKVKNMQRVGGTPFERKRMLKGIQRGQR